MDCQFCKTYTEHSDHASEDCPHLASLYCRRCQSFGHLVSSCEEPWAHWERPACLEELIPYHLRVRYGIQTVTNIEYTNPRGSEETFKELSQEIQVPGNDKKMRRFMENYGIKSVHKGTQNLQIIKDWAKERGLRVRVLVE